MSDAGVMASRQDTAEQRQRRWRVRFWVALAIAAIAALPYAAVEAYRMILRLDPEWRFVEAVALRPAPGGENPVVVRWTIPPRIALIDATDEDEAFVRTYVDAVNRALEGSGLSAQLVADGTGNLHVYFAPSASFDRLAANFVADPVPPGVGFYMVWPGKRQDIITAVAVVGARLDAPERRAAIARELAHALGLRGRSAAFPDSVVFGAGSQPSTATALSPVDRRLLRLIYMNLMPGDGWREVRSGYEKFWKTH